MARPSQNVDQLLLDAGIELLPETGCAGLSVRRLTEHAGVNLGMFHYHFKNKDNFIRAVLQRVYEEMFSALTLEVDATHSALDNLRSATRLLARFGRERRALVLRLMADAMAGEPLAAEFLRANFPRHLSVIAGLIVQGQQAGQLVAMPPQNAMAFLFGSIAAPVLAGAAMQQHVAAPMAAGIEAAVLSDAAISQRIELALRALSAHAEGAPR